MILNFLVVNVQFRRIKSLGIVRCALCYELSKNSGFGCKTAAILRVNKIIFVCYLRLAIFKRK